MQRKNERGGRREDMMYEVFVTINNSPTKIRKWGYLIEADSVEEASEKAIRSARAKANKPYSRYKKCSLEVKAEDKIGRAHV